MSEKSGLEMLQEILKRLELIEKKIDVQDKNIKRIANTANMADLVTRASGTSMEDWSRANKTAAAKTVVAGAKEEIEKIKSKLKGKTRFKFEPADAAKLPGPSAMSHKRKSISDSTVMCKGKMLIENGESLTPIPGLSVKIFDKSDKLVKETKTNRAGHWMSQLPPGQYVALYEGQYNGESLVPINKNFEVPVVLPEGQKFVEVT